MTTILVTMIDGIMMRIIVVMMSEGYFYIRVYDVNSMKASNHKNVKHLLETGQIYWTVL